MRMIIIALIIIYIQLYSNLLRLFCGSLAARFDGLFEKLNVTRSQKGGAGN